MERARAGGRLRVPPRIVDRRAVRAPWAPDRTDAAARCLEDKRLARRPSSPGRARQVDSPPTKWCLPSSDDAPTSSRRPRCNGLAACVAVPPTTCARPGLSASSSSTSRSATPRPSAASSPPSSASTPASPSRPSLLPNAPGSMQQFLLTSLEGGANDFDVFIADVVLVAEMARAGWIADICDAFPADADPPRLPPRPGQRGAGAGRHARRPLVRRRRRLLLPHRPRPPRAEDLRGAPRAGARASGGSAASTATSGRACSRGRSSATPSRPSGASAAHHRARIACSLDTPAARAALELMRTFLVSGVSPPSVTSMAEEETRRVFEAGAAVFMRNWPYAFALLQGAGSPVRGHGRRSRPADAGRPPGARRARRLPARAQRAHAAWKREAALALIAHLTSPEANLVLAVEYGRLPARRRSYDDPRLVAGAPVIAAPPARVERARAAPGHAVLPALRRHARGRALRGDHRRPLARGGARAARRRAVTHLLREGS